MTQTEALKAAIDHIDRAIDEPNITMSDGKALKEIMRQLNLARAALGEALAQPEQEPVALEDVYLTIIQWDVGGGKRSRRELASRIVAKYTTPPQRKPLTDEEIWNLAANCLDSVAGRLQFARAIEAAHGIKE